MASFPPFTAALILPGSCLTKVPLQLWPVHLLPSVPPYIEIWEAGALRGAVTPNGVEREYYEVFLLNSLGSHLAPT